MRHGYRKTLLLVLGAITAVSMASAASLTVSSSQSFCGEVTDGSGNPYETVTIDASVSVCGSQGYANFTAQKWINVTSSGSINADGAGGAGGAGGYSDDYYGGGDSGEAGTGTGGAGGGYTYDPVDARWYGFEGKSGGINTDANAKTYSIGGGGGGGGASQSEEQGPADAGDGGAGAGAVVLHAGNRIEVSGNIYARGLNGGSGSVGDYSAQSAGGGAGGAGGTILVDAPEVEVTGSLNANGGSGGRGDCTGSNYERAVGGEGGDGGQIKFFWSSQFLNSSMSYSVNGGGNGVTECTFDGDRDRWTQDGSNGVYNTVRENLPPAQPSLSKPAAGETGLLNSVTLEVAVSDSNGDSMDVSFYDASDNTRIGTVQSGTSDGSTANVTWSGLNWGTQYSWYAEADDGSSITQSPTWNFETANPPVLESVSLSQDPANIVYGDTVWMEANVSDPAGNGISGVNFTAVKNDSTVFSGQNGTRSVGWQSAPVTANIVGEEIEFTVDSASSVLGAVSSFGSSLNFTISPPVPEAQPATSLGAQEATLQGELLEYGDFDSGDIDVLFRWRKASETNWSQTSAETFNSPGPVSQKLSGLKADTTYEYKTVATWNTEEQSSAETFTTDQPSFNITLDSPADNASIETTGNVEFNYTVESNVNGSSTLYLDSNPIATRDFESGEEQFSANYSVTSAGQTKWHVELEADNYSEQKQSEKQAFRISPTSFENVSLTISSSLPELFVGDTKRQVAEGETETFTAQGDNFVASQGSGELKSIIPAESFDALEFTNQTSASDKLSVSGQGKNDRFFLAANTGTAGEVSSRAILVRENEFLSVSKPSFTRPIPQEHTISVIKEYDDINITGDFAIDPGASSQIRLEASDREFLGGRRAVNIEGN